VGKVAFLAELFSDFSAEGRPLEGRRISPSSRRVDPADIAPGMDVLVLPDHVSGTVEAVYDRFVVIRAAKGYSFTVHRHDLLTGEAEMLERRV